MPPQYDPLVVNLLPPCSHPDWSTGGVLDIQGKIESRVGLALIRS
jgi:hypothetical protein